jgi:hypothetical protein
MLKLFPAPTLLPNMASVCQPSELQSVVALVKTMTNAQLKEILRSEGLTVSGVKASLQFRIIECLLPRLISLCCFQYTSFSIHIRSTRRVKQE